MEFLQINDFYKVIQQDELTDIVGEHTLPTDEGTITLEALELDAIGEMSGYLAVRYDSTKCFDTQTDRIPIIIQKCADIVLYNAYSLVAPNNIPTMRTTRYENAINWLEKVASGYINPDFPTKEEQPKTPLRYGSANPKQDNFF